MLSLEKCKEILNENQKKYTEEEVKLIQKFLNEIVEIERKFRHDTGKQDGGDIFSSVNRRTS